MAWVGLRVLLVLSPVKVCRRSPTPRLDWRVVGFTLAVSVLTGIALRHRSGAPGTRTDLNDGLRDGGRGTAGSRRAHRTRNLLVVAEVALAMVLLVGAVLLLQTFVRLLSVDAGFRPGGRVDHGGLAAAHASYPAPRAADFFDRVDARLGRCPRSAARRRDLGPAAERASRTCVKSPSKAGRDPTPGRRSSPTTAS